MQHYNNMLMCVLFCEMFGFLGFLSRSSRRRPVPRRRLISSRSCCGPWWERTPEGLWRASAAATLITRIDRRRRRQQQDPTLGLIPLTTSSWAKCLHEGKRMNESMNQWNRRSKKEREKERERERKKERKMWCDVMWWRPFLPSS